MEKDTRFPNKRIITANELMTMLSISSTTLWRHVRDDRLTMKSCNIFLKVDYRSEKDKGPLIPASY